MSGTEWVQVPPLPGRHPETTSKFCYFCRTGKRQAGGVYCSCNNPNCPFPIGSSTTARPIPPPQGFESGGTPW